MADVKFSIDENFGFDIDIENGDFVLEDGFDTALYLSLFTDARANETQVLIPEYRRGWLGDLVSPIDDRQLGGHLWLVDQRRLTQSTLNETIDYCKKSLQWMIDDELCTKIEISGSIVPRHGIELEIEIYSKSGVTTNKNIKIWQYTGV